MARLFRKGEKGALSREMGAAGEYAPKLPALEERKTPVTPTPELIKEAISRFACGETLTAICRDPRMPSRQSIWTFSRSDPRWAQMWEAAKATHAESLMDEALAIGDADMKAPDGRVDNGAVQRARLRADLRHLRAAALDPARWSPKHQTTIVGDPSRPITFAEPMSQSEVATEMGKILAEAEQELGLPVNVLLAPKARLSAILAEGRPIPPNPYRLLSAPRGNA